MAEKRCEVASTFSPCAEHPYADSIVIRVTGGNYRQAPCVVCSIEKGPRTVILDLGDGHTRMLVSIRKSGILLWDTGACDCH